MGFYNIVLEGQQADEYRKKKNEYYAKLNAQSSDTLKDVARDHKRFIANPELSKKAEEVEKRDSDKRDAKAAEIEDNYDESREKELHKAWQHCSNADRSYFRTADAIARHMRRHPDQWKDGKHIGPKKEAGIFESVEFLK